MANVSWWVYQETLLKTELFNVEFHALWAVFPICGSTIAITASTLGLELPATVELASGAQSRSSIYLLQVKFVFFQQYLGIMLGRRVDIEVKDHFFDLLGMRVLCMGHNFIFLELPWAVSALDTLEIRTTYFIVFVLLLKDVFLLAELTDQFHFIDYLGKGAWLKGKWFYSAEGALV
jgi:hypothetical protein